MKLRLMILPAVVFAAGAAGCISLRAPAKTDGEPVHALTADNNIVLGNRILSAIQEKDYQAFHAMLGRGVFAKEMNPADFETSCQNFEKQFGEIVAFSFLADLKTPGVSNLIWRVSFERPSANPGGDPITQELLFRLVTGTLDAQPEVMRMGFL